MHKYWRMFCAILVKINRFICCTNKNFLIFFRLSCNLVVPLPVNLTVRDYCLVMEGGRGNGTWRAGASVCVVNPKIIVIKYTLE